MVQREAGAVSIPHSIPVGLWRQRAAGWGARVVSRQRPSTRAGQARAVGDIARCQRSPSYDALRSGQPHADAWDGLDYILGRQVAGLWNRN